MLGFLSSVILSLTIAANRMKINSASVKTSNLTGTTNAYYMEGQTNWWQGRQLLLLFPIFWSNFFEVNSGVLFFD